MITYDITLMKSEVNLIPVCIGLTLPGIESSCISTFEKRPSTISAVKIAQLRGRPFDSRERVSLEKKYISASTCPRRKIACS